MKGEVELGFFGVDLIVCNEVVKFGDDFFMYVSGIWYDNYELFVDKICYGVFMGFVECSEE